MNKLILSSLFLVLVSNTPAVAAPKCEKCEQVDKLISDLENEDHLKAYDQFYKIAEVDEFSKDKSVREQEVASLVKGIVKFMPHDVSKDLPAFALNMQKKYPKEFKAAISTVSREERSNLEKYMKITDDIMDKGEEEAERQYYRREAKMIGQQEDMAAKDNAAKKSEPAPATQDKNVKEPEKKEKAAE